jgi:Flp pilus assembly protein TadD
MWTRQASVTPEPNLAAASTAGDSDLAAQAKRDAQDALEKGQTAQAIEAGERCVALDSSDAEAWLILGAAYDQKGAHGEARRCFATCAQLAKRGPWRECAALLR